MTTRLRLEELTIQTSEQRKTYRFGETITPIIGPVGSGKTSLLELFKYAMGGGAALSNTVKGYVQTVVVRVRFSSQTLVFARRINGHTVDVHDADGTLVETVATRSSAHHRTASQFLLEAAGLPALTITRGRGTPGNRIDNLSFFDVFRYCYVSQSEIDRSVVRHDDTILERRRKAAFEMVFGLSDVETAAADRAVGELGERLAAARQEESSVRRFLEQAGEQPEVELHLERESVQDEMRKARQQLSAVREDMRAATADEADKQRRVAVLAQQVREMNEQAILLQAQLRQHATDVARYELQLEQFGRRAVARRVLDQIEFSLCPRCMQSILARPVEEGACMLCTQPEPARPTLDTFSEPTPEGQLPLGGFAVNDERRRIESLRDDVADLAEEDREELVQVLDRQRALEVTMRLTLDDLDRRTEQYVSPRFEVISDLSARAARAEGRLRAIDNALKLWQRFRDLTQQASDLESQLGAAKAAADASHRALDERRSVVDELSEAFDDQVRRLEPPWYEGAVINPKSYLPELNGASFESLSGGEKTMVNVAYHLALLTVALARRDTYLPALLIIDTPRKNLGSGYDQSYAERIYRQIVALADAHRGRFQLLIADNDPPPMSIDVTNPIVLTYDNPLIPGVDHPGEAVIPVQGGEETDR